MMNWIPESANFLPHDWEVFDYREKEAVAIQKLHKDSSSLESTLCSSVDWEEWFSKAAGVSHVHQQQPGLHLLLCSRGPQIFKCIPSEPNCLPFTEYIFKKIVQNWHVHRGITRVISRKVAFFTSIRHKNQETGLLEISYCARMSSGLPEDLAISVTYIPESKSIFSILYGCSYDQINKIRRKISIADDELSHPLLMIGLFAELERERIINAVDNLMDSFTLRSDILKGKYWNKQLNMESSRIKENLALCLRSHQLIDHMGSVKRQLKKLSASIKEFNKWINMKEQNGSFPLKNQEDREKLAQIGTKIRSRVQDIMTEYDEKMDECKTIEESLSLVMQTLWNQIAQTDSQTNTEIAQANTMIALETKGESVQMRSIALLTMIYIPLSCVASVFSTTLFNFPSDDNTIVSEYIWVFVVVSFVLTFVTVMAWHFATNYEKKKEKRSNSFQLAKGCNMV